MKKELNICFATDDNYAPYMGLAILSILKHAAGEEKFHFYILDNAISQDNKQKIDRLHDVYPFQITYLPLQESIFEGCDTYHANWTYTIFGRYLIGKIIPVDKVLYLDCDIMVRGSLLPLWKENIDDFYLAGVLDYNIICRGDLLRRFNGAVSPDEYVNSGVLLINNRKWREENLFQKLLTFSVENAKKLRCPDQDAINYICRLHKKILPERYNIVGFMYKSDLFLHHPRFSEIAKERNQTVIRHFHPWKKNFFVPYREEYLELMQNSPWKDLCPVDDAKPLAWFKTVLWYLWRHPFCFLLPRFYIRWYYRGAKCLFMDY